MPDKYNSAPQEDTRFFIYRDGVHIATYDPVEESTSWVLPKYQRFNAGVVEEVNRIKNGAGSDDFPPEVPEREAAKVDPINPTGMTAEPSLVAPVEEVKRLKARITQLEMDKAYLLDENAKLKRAVDPTGARPAPFGGADLSTAPKTDPNLGDLTPAFIEWARENLPADVFERHYRNRLPKTNKTQTNN